MLVDSLGQEFGQSLTETNFSRAGILGKLVGSNVSIWAVRMATSQYSQHRCLPGLLHCMCLPHNMMAQAPSTNIPAHSAATAWPS